MRVQSTADVTDDRPNTDADRALRASVLLDEIDPADHPQHAALIDRAQDVADDLAAALQAETGREGSG